MSLPPLTPEDPSDRDGGAAAGGRGIPERWFRTRRGRIRTEAFIAGGSLLLLVGPATVAFSVSETAGIVVGIAALSGMVLAFLAITIELFEPRDGDEDENEQAVARLVSGGEIDAFLRGISVSASPDPPKDAPTDTQLSGGGDRRRAEAPSRPPRLAAAASSVLRRANEGRAGGSIAFVGLFRLAEGRRLPPPSGEHSTRRTVDAAGARASGPGGRAGGPTALARGARHDSSSAPGPATTQRSTVGSRGFARLPSRSTHRLRRGGSGVMSERWWSPRSAPGRDKQRGPERHPRCPVHTSEPPSSRDAETGHALGGSMVALPFPSPPKDRQPRPARACPDLYASATTRWPQPHTAFLRSHHPAAPPAMGSW